MKIKLAIITEKSHVNRFLKHIDSSDDLMVVAWNQEVAEELKRKGISYKSVKDYYTYDYSVGVNWMKELAKKEFLDSKNLISLLSFQDTSLWWWMESWLYASYAYYDSFEDIIKSFYMLNSVVEQEKPDKIIYMKQGLAHDRIIRQICKSKGIETKELASTARSVQFKIVKATKMHLINSYFNLRYISRKMIWNVLLRGKKRIAADNNEKIAADNDRESRPILFVYFTNERNKLYVEPILKGFRNSDSDLYALDASGSNQDIFNISTMRRKIKDREVKHLLLENFLRYNKSNKSDFKKELARFKRIWKQLRKDSRFKSLFTIEGVDLWDVFEQQLDAYFKVRLKPHLMDFFAVASAVEAINPAVTVSQVETSEFDKGLFVAARKRNIPSVAIQHGIVSEDIRMIHDKDEISLKHAKPEHCPIPDITAVYGDVEKKDLVKEGNYSKESVIVTGNQRYDPLANPDFDKKEIYNAVGIDPDKKIVLFASQVMQFPKDKEILFESICKTFKEMDDLQLVVKVHPGEGLGFYEKMISQYGIKAKVTEYDVFKMLYVCDALLVMTSGVGIEAAILDKPMIMINLANYPVYVDYAEEGIALPVYKAEDLNQAVRRIVSDKKLLEELKKNRNLYIQKHCYKIDGKSSERIIALIKKMGKTERKVERKTG